MGKVNKICILQLFSTRRFLTERWSLMTFFCKYGVFYVILFLNLLMLIRNGETGGWQMVLCIIMSLDFLKVLSNNCTSLALALATSSLEK